MVTVNKHANGDTNLDRHDNKDGGDVALETLDNKDGGDVAQQQQDGYVVENVTGQSSFFDTILKR